MNIDGDYNDKQLNEYIDNINALNPIDVKVVPNYETKINNNEDAEIIEGEVRSVDSMVWSWIEKNKHENENINKKIIEYNKEILNRVKHIDI